MPCCHGSRHRQGANGPDARIDEHDRTRVERGAGCHHVVYQDDCPITELYSTRLNKDPGPSTHHERSADVARPPRGRKRGLGRATGAASENTPHRQSHLACEIVGLIEAAPNVSPRIEWNRDDRISTVEELPAGRAHQRRQRFGKGPASAVLERVHDFAKRAVVQAHAQRPFEPRRRRAAASAQRRVGSSGERVTASGADRWDDPHHAAPTSRTDWTVERQVEQIPAGSTAGFEKRSNERVQRMSHVTGRAICRPAPRPASDIRTARGHRRM